MHAGQTGLGRGRLAQLHSQDQQQLPQLGAGHFDCRSTTRATPTRIADSHRRLASPTRAVHAELRHGSLHASLHDALCWLAVLAGFAGWLSADSLLNAEA